MTNSLQYDDTAVRKILPASHWDDIETDVVAAGQELFADVSLLTSGNDIPTEKQPLDAGFVELPKQLLTDYAERSADSLVGKILTAAETLRAEWDRTVLLGIGGSYMGARALFEALLHPYHNELSREQRSEIPRLSFAGNNIDNDVTRGLLELVTNETATKTGVVVISKSGGTLETAVAFRLFLEALEQSQSPEKQTDLTNALQRLIVPITGETGKLRELSKANRYQYLFPIPDDVGGRFSIFTAVGLFPAAMMGLDIVQLLEGAAAMTERLRTEPFGNNPVLDFTATSHLMETKQGCDIRVLSTWGARLEAVGLWYDQLLAESLGKEERGATPLTAVNTRDLHSRGQQHQEGRQNKLITNLIVQQPTTAPLAIPKMENDHDQLNRHAGKTMPTLLQAAIAGTNQAYATANRPTANITLPKLTEHTLGQLFQMLMLSTVVEGRLLSINPYGQPGVEAYKQNMTKILN